MNTKGSNKKWTFSNLSKFRYTKHQIPFGFMQYPYSMGVITTLTGLVTQWTERCLIGLVLLVKDFSACYIILNISTLKFVV